MNRFLHIVALVVLLVSAAQIGMCAFDCNCFLPSASGVSSRSGGANDPDGCGDADGCLCCALYGHVTSLMQVPGLIAADFTSFVPPLYIALVDASLPYHPPRS